MFVNRLSATLVCLSHNATRDVLAAWFRVDRSTVTRAVNAIRPLLAERGCRIEGGVRLRTLAGVIAHLDHTGLTGVDGRYRDQGSPSEREVGRAASVRLRQVASERHEGVVHHRRSMSPPSTKLPGSRSARAPPSPSKPAPVPPKALRPGTPERHRRNRASSTVTPGPPPSALSVRLPDLRLDRVVYSTMRATCRCLPARRGPAEAAKPRALRLQQTTSLNRHP
ncbi:helix-turn-helix domain-containing protein [Actinokineospora pegani]|uniref:helix-turn-helix domain-containing protein n=1 Tax=Actinokineospora pegani TaxID=2654637 RepID=UPI0018D2D5DE